MTLPDDDARLPETEPDQSSRQPRHITRLPSFAVLEDRTTISLTVVDLSYDGCKVETAVALATGSRLTLSVENLGVHQADVRWCRNGTAGLRFCPETAEAKALRPREHDRVNLRASVALRRAGSIGYTVSTTDVSPSGCKVEFVDKPLLGEIHWLKFQGLEALQAEVRWVEAFTAGVQFKYAIHPAVFDMLVARLSSA